MASRFARTTFGTGRLACAAAVAISLVARYLWSAAWIDPANFFAYLTIQSNIAFVVVSTIGGVIALRSGLDHPRLDAARVLVLTYVVTAGIVFALIVQQSGARGVRIDVSWSDVALHFILPVVALADWMLSPRRTRVSFRALAWVAGYPIVWGGITMLRGPIVNWYPYYFLDPGQVSDPLEFVTLSGLALAVFLAVGTLLLVAKPIGGARGT
jgi:hypothetical protein